ncbi:MAG: hypothetical protein RBT67_08560 [Thauera sp.]|jgi:hypothetical protein|nr:hypothetical protein [Thauera sp.]
MSEANLKLRIAFDFELEAPEALLAFDQAALIDALRTALGATVLQGMPTISAKQFAKIKVALVGHQCQLDVSRAGLEPVSRDLLAAAAPHLTDREMDALGKAMAGKLPESPEEARRLLRRKALALVNELRTLDCTITAKLSSGAEAELSASLDLTNGGVIVAEQDRRHRLQAGQGAVAVQVPGCNARLSAAFSGHTISGPVLGVDVAQLSAHRDALISAWQSALQQSAR